MNYGSFHARIYPHGRPAGPAEIKVWSIFFTSRRRHTRLQGDWSSDVCSSDLSRRRLQLGEIGHGPDAERALRAGHRREVDVGLVDALADPLVLDRPAALVRHALLVELVVVEGAVVGNDEQARDAVVRGGPQRRDAHQEIAVAEDPRHHPAAVLERERSSHDHARTGADAAAAVAAKVVERVLEVAVWAAPPQLQPPQPNA